MKKSNIPFNRSNSSLVLVYSNGERFHVEYGVLNPERFEYNDALQLTQVSYFTQSAANHTKAKGVSVDTYKTQETFIDCVKSGLAFIVATPCPIMGDGLVSGNVYTCAGIRSPIHGEDISFIADALAYGLNG